MSSPLTPPPSLFPSAVTWITPLLLPRFQAILGYQPNAMTAGNGGCLPFIPGCSAPITGESFHIWKFATPEDEWFRTCTTCGIAPCNPDQARIQPSLGVNYRVAATIGDGTLLTLHGLAAILTATISPPPAIAIRWGILFSTATIAQLTKSTDSLHFLGYP